MARFPRPDLAGIPQHVVQWGNNRLPCSLGDGDRQRYLQCLRAGLMRFGCQLHAYVLMGNHVHLLLTPGESGAVSRLMHTFARNYVGLFNGRHGRTGTLWEGRYKACLLPATLEDAEHAHLACRPTSSFAFANASEITFVALEHTQFRLHFGHPLGDALPQLVEIQRSTVAMDTHQFGRGSSGHLARKELQEPNLLLFADTTTT